MKTPKDFKLNIQILKNEDIFTESKISLKDLQDCFIVVLDAIKEPPTLQGQNTSHIGALNSAATLELIFLDDAEIRKINAKYRGINAPTDVVSLSYLAHENFPTENLLGEIFISLDTAKKQAREDGRSEREEIIFLFIHGLLHIFGYDHENPAEKEKMFALQDEIYIKYLK